MFDILNAVTHCVPCCMHCTQVAIRSDTGKHSNIPIPICKINWCLQYIGMQCFGSMLTITSALLLSAFIRIGWSCCVWLTTRYKKKLSVKTTIKSQRHTHTPSEWSKESQTSIAFRIGFFYTYNSLGECAFFSFVLNQILP